jgi:Glycosyl transferases group 1
MISSFNIDPYPGKPKILFIGLAESTHTHSWIDLLNQSELNVRLFAMPSGVPPGSWPVRTYVTDRSSGKLNSAIRDRLYPRGRLGSYIKMRVTQLLLGDVQQLADRWLARVIRKWRPTVIHTLGLDPAAFFYYRVRHGHDVAGIGKWVLQLRGGSDLTLTRLDPQISPKIGEILRDCHHIISDNAKNYEYALEMGIRREQISQLGTVPGTGGVEADSLAEMWHGATSSRRMIIIPKAYDCPWSLVLPVLEAIKLVWNQITPCEIHMLAATPETRMWYWDLPESIRQYCHIEDRIPHQKVLELMRRARVMLAASLVDGTPNSMFEAMALGAFPILSPLDTIRPLVKDGYNVLFARNLYPQDIAEALVRAMTDDELVDRAAKRNLELVKGLADRNTIRMKVTNYYQNIATDGPISE